MIDERGALPHVTSHVMSRGTGAAEATEAPEAEPRAFDAMQLADYARLGWAACPDFFSSSDVDEIRHWTDEVAASPEMPDRQMLYREPSCLDPGTKVVQRIENFCPQHAGFDRLIRRDRLLRAVEQLLGRPAVLFKEKINFKMPGGAGFEAHQDQQAGWSAYAPAFITAMVSIDAATLDNGCLELSTKPRRTGLIGREWSPLTPAELGDDVLAPVPTRPGDVLFFDSFVPHASKPNRTRQSRRILYLTYNALVHGDHRERYFAAKRAAFPPDIERDPDVVYRFRV